MQLIPLLPVPSQSVSCVLDTQNVSLNIYQKTINNFTPTFVDVFLNGNLIISAWRALNGIDIISQQYFGFNGGLFFIDTQGNDDPTYQGLGTRFVLVYLLPNEIPAGEGF